MGVEWNIEKLIAVNVLLLAMLPTNLQSIARQQINQKQNDLVTSHLVLLSTSTVSSLVVRTVTTSKICLVCWWYYSQFLFLDSWEWFFKLIFVGSKSDSLIKANVNQNYDQPSWKLKTVRLKVGGRATIYEGTKLKIRCPVKKFKRYVLNYMFHLYHNKLLMIQNNCTIHFHQPGRAFFGSKETNEFLLEKRINVKGEREDDENISRRRKAITFLETLLLQRKGPYKFGRQRWKMTDTTLAWVRF